MELSRVDRSGRALLFLVYLALLGGRFTLDRISPTLPSVDLRWVGVGGLLLAYGFWRAAASPYEQPSPRDRPGFVWFLVWLGWMAISAIWAPPLARVGGVLSDLALMAAFIGIAIAVGRRLDRGALNAVWWWIFITALVYLAAALASDPDPQGRYSAFGGGPNVFVRVVLLGALAAFYLAVQQRRYWTLLMIPFLGFGALLSGSRGGLLAMVVMALFFGLPFWRRLAWQARHGLVAASVAALMLSPFVSIRLPISDYLRERFVEQTFKQHYDSGRSDILDASWHLLANQPLTGAGLDGFYGLVGVHSGHQYPHNLIVATLAEGGLIGGLLLLIALAAPVRHALQRPWSTGPLFFTSAAGFVAVASLFSGDYYDSRFLWFFLALAVFSSHAPGRGRGQGDGSGARDDFGLRAA
jgi:O-antigen ligase